MRPIASQVFDRIVACWSLYRGKALLPSQRYLLAHLLVCPLTDWAHAEPILPSEVDTVPAHAQPTNNSNWVPKDTPVVEVPNQVLSPVFSTDTSDSVHDCHCHMSSQLDLILLIRLEVMGQPS